MVWFNRHVVVPQFNSVPFPKGSWEGTGLLDVSRGCRDRPACPGLTAAPWPTSPWFLEWDLRGEGWCRRRDGGSSTPLPRPRAGVVTRCSVSHIIGTRPHQNTWIQGTRKASKDNLFKGSSHYVVPLIFTLCTCLIFTLDHLSVYSYISIGR